MKKDDYVKHVTDWKTNLVREKIPKSEHLDLDFNLSDGWKFAGETPRSQYIEKINPGIHLSTVLGKLNILKDVVDPINFERYFPKQIAQDLVRFCELNREKDLVAYRHQINQLIYGVLSPEHTLVYDADVYDIQDNLFDGMPVNTTYQCDDYRSTINIQIPDLSIELPKVDGKQNQMQYRMTIGNSMFGVGSIFVQGGSWEMICANGVMGWVNQFSWRASHVHKTAELLLRELSKNITNQLSLADKYNESMIQANEVNQRLFKEKDDVIKVLRDKRFGLQKQEAEKVFKLLRTKKSQYSRNTGEGTISNAFDVGRVIAEVARDTSSFNRQLELEQIAGRVIVMQIH